MRRGREKGGRTQLSEVGVAEVQSPPQFAMYTMTGPIVCGHVLYIRPNQPSNVPPPLTPREHPVLTSKTQ